MLAAAGVKSLDYLVSTHYHVDHIGGMTELAKTVPIKTFVDHGPTVEPKEQINGFQAAYAELFAQGEAPGRQAGRQAADRRHRLAHRDRRRQGAQDAAPGRRQAEPALRGLQAAAEPAGRRELSLGRQRRQLRQVPDDRSRRPAVGHGVRADVPEQSDRQGRRLSRLASRHRPVGIGALVHGLEPRVAIMQNGTRKGGTLQTTTTLNSSPNLEDIWQLHWSYNVGVEGNPPGLMIANVDEPAVIAQILTAPPRGGGPRRRRPALVRRRHPQRPRPDRRRLRPHRRQRCRHGGTGDRSGTTRSAAGRCRGGRTSGRPRRRRRRRTPGRRAGSRFLRKPTAASPSPIRATASAGRITQIAGRARVRAR